MPRALLPLPIACANGAAERKITPTPASLQLPAGTLAGIPDLARIIRCPTKAPCRIDQFPDIIFRPPGEPKFRLAVIHPGRVIGTWNVDRRQPSRVQEIGRHLSIIDGLVHAHIEQFALSQRVIKGGDYRLDEVVDMHEIALERTAFGIPK